MMHSWRGSTSVACHVHLALRDARGLSCSLALKPVRVRAGFRVSQLNIDCIKHLLLVSSMHLSEVGDFRVSEPEPQA
jgi:hypothetical protein